MINCSAKPQALIYKREVVMERGFFKVALLAGVVLFVYSCGAAPHKQNFDAAMKENRIGDAYGIARDVCAKTPSDPLCKALPGVSAAYAGERLGSLDVAIKAEKSPMPLGSIESFKKALQDVKAIDASIDTSAVEALIKGESGKTTAAMKSSVEKAAAMASSGDLKGAYDMYKEAAYLDPSMMKEVNEFKAAALASVYSEGTAAKAAGDWRGAHKAFSDVSYMEPSYKKVKKLLEEAAGKDTYEYHLSQGKSAVAVDEYTRGLGFYESAANYNDTDEVKGLIRSAKVGAAKASFEDGVALLGNGSALSGGVKFLSAISYFKALPRRDRKSIKVPSKELTRLLDELSLGGHEELEDGNKGLAYVYFKVLSEISPDYPEAVSMREELSADMSKGAKSTLAVIPFGGPSYHVDAGNLMTSRILNFLYKELSNDIRILERGAMEALMKESEVKTMQGGGVNKGLLSILNADYLLVGNVDDYKVESQVDSSNRTTRGETGVKRMPNPAHAEWVKRKKGTEPPSILEEPVYETVKYKVTYHKKSVSVTIGYRIVDARGDVVHTNIVEKKKVVEAESSEGVELGKLSIPTKRANLPSDGDLLKAAELEAIGDLGADMTRIFSDPDVKLLVEARTLADKGNFKTALKKITRAMFIAENKGKDIKAIEKELYAIIGKGSI